MEKVEQEVEWHAPFARSTAIQAIVPSFDVIVCSYSHLENAPAGGRPGVAVDPCFRDVLGKLLQLVCCCFSSQLLEHWPDFTFGQERERHKFTHILVCAVVMIVLVLESKLLNLKTTKLLLLIRFSYFLLHLGLSRLLLFITNGV